MHRTALAFAAVLLAANAFATPPALPADQTVQYVIHAVPSDPTSVVTVTITLSLRAVERDGDDVGWAVSGLHIKDHTAREMDNDEWAARNVPVPTADGLWWITHNDPLAPAAAEFAVPPALYGTAAAIIVELAPAIQFVLQGHNWDVDAPHPLTSNMDVELTEEGSGTSLTSLEDGPVNTTLIGS